MIVHEMENELIKIWNLIVALSDQLQENRVITTQLRTQADVLKVRIRISPPQRTAYSVQLQSTALSSHSNVL